MKVTACRYHCSGCDSHFSSLAAFDAHRHGHYHTKNSRWCEEPLDDPRFMQMAMGRCTLQRPLQVRVVPIYTLRDDVETVRRAFPQKRVDGMEAA